MFDMGGMPGESWLEFCHVEPQTTSGVHPAPYTTRTLEHSVELCRPGHEADHPPLPVPAPCAFAVRERGLCAVPRQVLQGEMDRTC
jgi:hypothetical protein